MTLTTNAHSPGNPSHPLWIALLTVLALIVGITAGAAAWARGDDPVTAVFTGFGVFGGALLLFLAVYRALTA
jgi:hypothetical protein